MANQFEIRADDATYFQSYNTIVAKKHSLGLTLDEGYPYSRTTGKYLKAFTGYSVTELRQMVKDGRVQIADLNS